MHRQALIKKALTKMLLMTLLALSTNFAWATAQVADRVEYGGEVYSLIGLAGELPTPETFGMTTKGITTANWRGYVATYRINAIDLELIELIANTEDQIYPEIAGRKPTPRCRRVNDICSEMGATYAGLNHAVEFTGRLRIARDFVPGQYVHMGYQKPSAFKVVLDLVYVDGTLVELIDRSEEAKKIRGEFKKWYETAQIGEGIGTAFSLSMERLR